MSTNSDASNVSRRQFLAVASSAAAASSLAVGKNSTAVNVLTPPPTPAYPVTIDVTTTPILYTYTDANGATHTANRLIAAANGSITWKAKTPSSNQHHVILFFLKETPILDTNKKPVYAFFWQESDEAGGVGGTIDPDAAGTYEYYVAVIDKQTKSIYVDDPKIIVGSGGIELRTKLFEELAEIAKSCPKESENIKSIETKLQQLLK